MRPTMKLLYEGTLDGSTAEYAVDMVRKYPHVVELHTAGSEFWRTFIAWANKFLPKHPYTTDSGCSGEIVQRECHMYGSLRKNSSENEMFLFFQYKNEKEQFMSAFPQHVVSESPFKTLLEA